MKHSLKSGIAIIIGCLLSVAALSQNKKQAPWASDNGYWVIESNIHNPLHSIIRFYIKDNTLIYTENIDGVKLNPEKRKVKMKLKEALETSVLAWMKNKIPGTNKDYVKNLIH